MTIGQRLDLILKWKKISPNAFAKRRGVTQKSIWRLLNDPKSGHRNDIVGYAMDLDIDPKWLAKGIGVDPRLETNYSKIKRRHASPVISWEDVPVLWNKIDTIDIKEIDEQKIMLGADPEDKTYALKIKPTDLSMAHTDDPDKSPAFFPGEKILVDPFLKPKINQFVIAYKKSDQEPYLRKYTKSMGGYSLIATHRSYAHENIKVDSSIVICGTVICKTKDTIF